MAGWQIDRMTQMNIHNTNDLMEATEKLSFRYVDNVYLGKLTELIGIGSTIGKFSINDLLSATTLD